MNDEIPKIDTGSELLPVETICPRCEKPFMAKQFKGMSRVLTQYQCSPCEEAARIEHEAAEAAKERNRREQAWASVTDGFERLANSDPKRLPAPLVAKANSWDWRGGRSLMFAANKAGLGKSRCAFIALRRAFDAGRRCSALSAVRLERLATRGIYDDDKKTRWAAEAELEDARSASVLLLDDIDKPKWTPASEKELFEILDSRHAAMKSTIWTSNTLREDLGALWSEERRAAILRRLTDDTDIAEVKL